MEDIESNLEEKINIEDLILPSDTDNTDQNIVACSSTIMKEEILDKFEETGQNSNHKSSPSEYFQDDETEENLLSTNGNNSSREKSASEICTECGLEFGNKKILEIHMSVVHINPIAYSNKTERLSVPCAS